MSLPVSPVASARRRLRSRSLLVLVAASAVAGALVAGCGKKGADAVAATAKPPFQPLTHEQLQAALESAGATPDDDGWLVMPKGRSISLFEAHDGVGHEVPKVTALLVKNELVRARDADGVEHQVMAKDVFATSSDGRHAEPPRLSAAVPSAPAPPPAVPPPAPPVEKLALEVHVFALHPAAPARLSPGFTDGAFVRAGYDSSGGHRPFGFGVVVEVVNNSDMLLGTEAEPSGELEIEGERGSIDCKLVFVKVNDGGERFTSFTAPPKAGPLAWQSWSDESRAPFAPFETPWRPKERVRFVARAEMCGDELSVHEIGVKSVHGSVSISGVKGILPSEQDVEQAGSVKFSFPGSALSLQVVRLADGDGRTAYAAGGWTIVDDGKGDVKRVESASLGIDLGMLKNVPEQMPPAKLVQDELAMEFSGVALTQFGDMPGGTKKGTRDLAVAWKATVASAEIQARLDAAVAAAGDNVAARALAEAAAKRGSDPEHKRLAALVGCDSIVLVTSSGRVASPANPEDRAACASLSVGDEASRTLHFAIGRYEIPIGLLVRVGTPRFVPIASAAMLKFDAR